VRDVTADVVKAWALRRDGCSVREIAEVLGCSVSTAHERVKAAEAAEESTDSLDRSSGRIVEAARLDSYTAALEPLLTSDPLATVPVLLRVSAARRALLGLDQPSRIAIEREGARSAEPSPEIREAVRAAQEEAARERAQIRGQQSTEGGVSAA
jgi:DNA-binding Lrp family transcriptional regulator